MTPQDEYLETRVMTAQPHQLHLMVLDGAIRFMKSAEKALDEKDYEAAHFALGSSRDFVAELISGLDPAHTPELVDQLKALFVFVYRNLVRADLEHDTQLVCDALKILQIHRDTWVAMTQQLPAQSAFQPDSLPEDQPPASPHQPPHPHLPLGEQDDEAEPNHTGRSWST